MAERNDPLERIADALERMSVSRRGNPSWTVFPGYVWDGERVRGVRTIDALPLDHLIGIDRQKQRVTENVERHAKGHAAHDMLLWGARGMGKSALLRSAVVDTQQTHKRELGLVQVGAGALDSLPALFARLDRVKRRFFVFVDDLGFADDDTVGPRQLRSWLEGGVEARPANVRLAVTSNRRAILARQMSEQDDPTHPRDVLDDKLALADRFGIALGFHPCDKDTYLAIVETYADAHGLDWDKADAMEWAIQRGTRSGRTAWQYIAELAGRAGRSL